MKSSRDKKKMKPRTVVGEGGEELASKYVNLNLSYILTTDIGREREKKKWANYNKREEENS